MCPSGRATATLDDGTQVGVGRERFVDGGIAAETDDHLRDHMCSGFDEVSPRDLEPRHGGVEAQRPVAARLHRRRPDSELADSEATSDQRPKSLAVVAPLQTDPDVLRDGRDRTRQGR